MTTIAPAAAANPFARIALAVPAGVTLAVSVAARLTGAAAAIYYAYDQDVLFPDRHFPRTWAFAGTIAVVALLSLIPRRWYRATPAVAAFIGAFGCGLLLFAGADLAHKPAGVVVLVSGVVAVTAFATASYRRGEPPLAVAAGLLASMLGSFGLIGAFVFTLGR